MPIQCLHKTTNVTETLIVEYKQSASAFKARSPCFAKINRRLYTNLRGELESDDGPRGIKFWRKPRWFS